MDKEKVTLQLLMADASSYYTNLVASGNWKLEANKHVQIIALITQINFGIEARNESGKDFYQAFW